MVIAQAPGPSQVINAGPWASSDPSQSSQHTQSLQSQSDHPSRLEMDDVDPYAPVMHSEYKYTPGELAGQAVVEAKRVEIESTRPKPLTQYTTAMGRTRYKKGMTKRPPPPAVKVYNPSSLLKETPKIQSTVHPTSYISLETYGCQQVIENRHRQIHRPQIHLSLIDPDAPVPGMEGVTLLSQPPL